VSQERDIYEDITEVTS